MKLGNLVSAILLAPLLSLSLIGCKDEEVAPKILPQFNNYFPDTTLYQIDPRFLWIQTHIDGVSVDAVDLMFKQDCAESIQAIKSSSFGLLNSIPTALTIAGKEVLIVGFNHYWVVWFVSNGVDKKGIPVNYSISNYQQFSEWLTKVFKTMPTPDQIRVVSLENIQQNPAGKVFQAPTLAEVRQQKTPHPEEALLPLGY